MAILVVGNVVVLSHLSETSQKLEKQHSMTVETKSQLKKLTKEKKEVDSSLRDKIAETTSLKKENEGLKANLQAKKEREAKAAQLASVQRKQVAQAHTPAPTVQITGNKHTWLAASGIPESEWHHVDFIVGRESGWNPCAYNPGLSDCNANPTSACGLAQSLPCGKQSAYGHWTDPVANLKWQYEYVKARYGSYAGAVAFWHSNRWY